MSGDDKYVKIHVSTGDIYVYDRNVGASVPNISAMPTALNWINGTHDATNNPENLKFKGDYHTWDKAKSICPSGWILPTKTELQAIKTKLNISNGEVALIGTNGAICYFPLSGYDEFGESNVVGRYWSSTESTYSGQAEYLNMDSDFANVASSHTGNGYSVSCVKKVP